MQSGTRDAVFHGKLEKIEEALNWIEQHGTEKQKDQLDEAIREAGTQPLGGPSTEDMMRCSHEVQGISHGITEEDLKFVSRDERGQLLREEIRTRWKLINGLKYEIKELKGLQK